MAFLAPLFFLGLATLAIPVLIHLTQREKKMVQQFPSLMFVRRIPYQTVRRRKLRDLALLCVRLAALMLIVAAFARPFLWRPNAATAIGATAREVVVLLDQSYSMGYSDRWDRAKAAARDAINRLGPSDRASVVLFSKRSYAPVYLLRVVEPERDSSGMPRPRRQLRDGDVRPHGAHHAADEAGRRLQQAPRRLWPSRSSGTSKGDPLVTSAW